MKYHHYITAFDVCSFLKQTLETILAKEWYEIKLGEDYYWTIPVDSWMSQRTDTSMHIGSLNDDLASLRYARSEENDVSPILVDLDGFASIIRYVCMKIFDENNSRITVKQNEVIKKGELCDFFSLAEKKISLMNVDVAVENIHFYQVRNSMWTNVGCETQSFIRQGDLCEAVNELHKKNDADLLYSYNDIENVSLVLNYYYHVFLHDSQGSMNC